MNNLLTTRQARRIWEVSTKTLYQWIDEGTLELILQQGKPCVRIVPELPDELVKTRPGQQPVMMEMLRDLVSEELQRVREAQFMRRVVSALPIAALMGLVSVTGSAAIMGHQVVGGLMGALAAAVTFMILVTHALWMLGVEGRRVTHREHLDKIARGVNVETSSLEFSMDDKPVLVLPVGHQSFHDASAQSASLESFEEQHDQPLLRAAA